MVQKTPDSAPLTKKKCFTLPVKCAYSLQHHWRRCRSNRWGFIQTKTRMGTQAKMMIMLLDQIETSYNNQ